MDDRTVVAIVGLLVSGILGVSGFLLNFRREMASTSLEREARRSEAMNMLSDEELTLQLVREECRSFQYLLEGNEKQLGSMYPMLRDTAERTVAESADLLEQVRSKRAEIESRLETLSAPEIERVIADAYYGKTQAEAQLHRTRISKADTLKLYFDRSAGV